ncbi:FAD-dependent monooxygenase [Rothia uropygialis]|uniref:FAD-dependent monooxygenase n=1 Tax=Kocuria sp. 36 TaxID=1415402 RepID=UPI00101CB6AB|nr:FAD-dependent monooxygenase [Kocuria sp. 36]
MEISDLKEMNIAVIGGGYGGASAAMALDRLGAKVSVYERAKAVFEVGAGIGLRPPTVELFRKWGIFEGIEKVSSPSDHLEIYSADGKTLLAEEEWPHLRDYEQINYNRIIHRGDFIDVLLGALPEGMVHIGHRANAITDHGDHASVSFENGSEISADLVIGADGIRSRIREQLFSAEPPVYSGEHAYRVVIPIDRAHGLVTDNNPRFYMGENGTIAYNLPLRHRGDLSYDITAKSNEEAWEPEVTNEELVSLLEGFDSRIVAVARDLDMSSVTCRSVYDINSLDSWHTDSVALLGDAAHAMLHHQGQGANSAIADAAAIASALEQAGSVPEALRLYQEARKPVTDELQRVSRLGWDAKAVESAFPAQV